MFTFRREPLQYWFVMIFAPPGQGKSMEQANLSFKVLKQYRYTEKKYPYLPRRILFSNQLLNRDYLVPRYFSSDWYDLHYRYWRSADELRYCSRSNCWIDHSQREFLRQRDVENEYYDQHDVDIFIDEAARFFPSDQWAKTPKWLRTMWSQHRHDGLRIVMLTQDYQMVDINARRMLWQAYYVKKVFGSRDISPTLPPLQRWSLKNFLHPRRSVVWGVYSKTPFNPLVLKLDQVALLTLQLSDEKREMYESLKLTGRPYLRLITWHKVSLYDTLEKLRLLST